MKTRRVFQEHEYLLKSDASLGWAGESSYDLACFSFKSMKNVRTKEVISVDIRDIKLSTIFENCKVSYVFLNLQLHSFKVIL